MKIVDRRQRIAITDAAERVSVVDRGQRILIGPEPTGVEPPPEPEFFYGVDGGVARYDARELELADGAPVAVWAEASDQQGAAVQDVAGRQPTYTAAVPGVSFPGTSEHHLRLPAALAIDELTPFTLFVVAERTEINPVTGQLIGYGALSGQPWGVYQLTLERATWLGGGNQRVSASGAWPVGRDVVEFEMDGTNSIVRVGGVDTGLPRIIGTVPSQAVVPSLGAQLRPDASVVFPFAGVVHDVLFYNRVLTPAELTTVRAGLATDWSL